ncbi:MAG: sigma-70 family RNA polymerase sigma factor [Thermomicrobia bacterium]|nr:sigma-70 family RNA polymerase sigma factor [Thermomicrobia bacterium]
MTNTLHLRRVRTTPRALRRRFAPVRSHAILAITKDGVDGKGARSDASELAGGALRASARGARVGAGRMSWRRARPSTPRADTPADDEALVLAARHGDLDAYNRLVRMYERQAYAVALRLLRRPDLAEDATQDAFIQAYRALETFRGGSYRAWLMRIVTNRCYDLLRSATRRAADSLDDQMFEAEPHWSSIAAPDDPVRRATQAELGRLLEDALATLPEEQKLAVVLCDVQGYAYEEAAAMMGVALGTVKSRLSRARSTLREVVRGQEQFAEYRRSFSEGP